MLTKDECPDRARHTACPNGYIEWHDWAKRMSKTHKQTRCSTCGLWAIWKRRALEGNGNG